jgi:hypothetical protein
VYVATVEAARGRADGIELPWPAPKPGDTRPDAQHFWYLYLGGGKAPDKVAALALWKNLVPLRTPTGVTVTADGVEVRTEAFHWAHATAVVITVCITGEQALLDAVGSAVSARRDARYTMSDSSGGPQLGLTLDQALPAILARCASEVRGVDDATQKGPFDAFTAVTVIRGNADASLAPDATVVRALQALAKWSPSWPGDGLLPLDGSTVLKSRSPRPPAHVLYAATKGRVAWYPATFSAAVPRQHTLGCMHRNLTLLTMQTSALLGLVAIADTARDASDLRSQLLRKAVGLLGRLYGPGDSTPVDDMYQSWSARRQIEESGLAASINKYRTASNMGPLARPPAAGTPAAPGP